MRVCIISGDVVGGLRKHVHDILLAEQVGIEFFYIHSDVTDNAAEKDFAEIKLAGIKRLQLRVAKNPALSDLKNIITIWRECRRNRIDVLHGHAAKGGLYARAVGFLLRKPIVYTPHGGSVHARFGKAKILLFASVEYVLKFVTTLFVFESQYTCAAFRKLAGEIAGSRELVSFNGVHLDYLVPQTRWRGKVGRELRLLTVGQLSMVKGQDVVIHATSILESRGWQVSLDLCGDGENRHYFESLVSAYKLEEVVRFHGDVCDVRPYYEACDIVVIPSRFESFGYVAVEAALMERAIVASATGGLLETVVDGETGLGFTTGSSDALADAIEKTLADVDVTLKRIDAAQARAKELFDVNQMTARLFSTYRQLVLSKL